MDKSKAQQIMNDPNKIEVQFQQVPVWIERVQGSTADVSIIGTNRKMSVPLAQLEDTGRPVDSENIYGLH